MKSILGAFFALFLGSTAVSAAILQFTFEASVTEDFGTLSTGDTISGAFTYDSDAAAFFTSAPVISGYPLISMSLSDGFGGTLFSASGNSINVIDNGGGGSIDAFGITSGQGTSTGSFAGVAADGDTRFSFDFRGLVSTFSGLALPTDATSFNSLTGTVLGPAGSGAVTGMAQVTNVSLAPVPLPAAGLMLIAGLGGLAALRRRTTAA